MSLVNETPFAAQAVPLLDRDGNDVLVAIIKGTFVLDRAGKSTLAVDPSPVRLNDETFDPDNPRSSLRFSTDVGLATTRTASSGKLLMSGVRKRCAAIPS